MLTDFFWLSDDLHLRGLSSVLLAQKKEEGDGGGKSEKNTDPCRESSIGKNVLTH